jgi:hypothetical protein
MMVPLLLALAATSVPTDSLAVHRGDRGELEVSPPFVESVELRIDGSLDEPVWREAAVLTGFTQYEPAEGQPAAQRTEVRVFYTPEAMYFGIRAYDDRPDMVRATYADRDTPAMIDDWVRIVLDTFNDNRQAYIFYVNPLGIQQDGLWVEGGEKGQGSGNQPIDFRPDFIWDSRGRLDADGWTVEIRIPYVSLRFREAEVQTWGVNFAREVKRTGFKESWAPLTQNQASTLAQSGRLVGLQGIRPKRLVEVTPVATGKKTGQRVDGVFARDDFQPDFGMNGRYGITQNLILDATYNPDFSQVEADEGQIVVNERFAIQLPEKRPFFLEGTEIFRTPQRLVYTRSIVNPIGGAKVTGKLGSTTLGYLGALDESPISGGLGDRGLFNLFRLQRDVGQGSSLGLLLTDRTLSGSGAFNRVGGLDTRMVFGGRYAFTGQVAGSWSRDTAGVDLPVSPLLHLQLERSGRNLSWQARFTDLAPDFQARSGFLQRVGDTQLFLSGQYTFYGRPGALVERWGPEIRVDNYFDHAGFWRGAQGHQEGEVELQWNMLFRGKNRINTLLRYGHFNFDPEDYATYRAETAPGGVLAPFEVPDPLRHMLAIAVFPNLQARQWLTIGGRVMYRELPIYTEANRGVEFMVGPNVKIWPSAAMNVELAQTHSRLWRAREESLFSTANISRARVRYQFNRALSARVMAQYSLQNREPLRDPATGAPLWVRGRRDDGVEKGDFGFDVLASYEASPGRVVYLGWARQMTGPDTYRYDRMDPQAEGLFLKLSYLMRM